MRALLLHANKFRSEIVEASTRPKKIVPENPGTKKRELLNCVVVFFCVEKNDTDELVNRLFKDVESTAQSLKTYHILVSPFAHLSQNIAASPLAKKLYQNLLSKFDPKIYTVETSQFGYHKSLLLDIKGHPGAFRYREYSA